ncbi:MAG: IS110 family transposase [Gemmatimonadaceae bacterium]
MIYVGLDLHKRYITACALDAVGTLLAEERRLATDLAVLLGWLGRLTGPVTVVLEATLYWAWLEQQLTALGYTVQVAHPYQVKLIWQARTKTDPIDARKLAELARVHLLPAIWIPDAATRAQRQLLRGRAFLVRQRTVLKNRIHAYLTAENLRSPSVDLYGRAGRTWLATLTLPPVVRRYVDLLLANLDLLTTQIVALDKYLQRHVRQDAVAQRLQTIPGVGPFGALLLQAEIGPIDRFRSAQELAAYAGLVPSTHSSGGKTRHGAVGRGSPWLKWIVVEILQTLKLAPGPVGQHYQKLLRAKGKPKATVAAARKFVTYLYWILKEEWSYPEWLRQHDRPEVRPVQPLGSVA